MTLDLAAVRARFPALALEHAGRPIAFFDGPGGTQVPEGVIEAVGRYYREANANSGGAFPTSERTDRLVAEARAAAADFLNAPSAEGIKFGANMTSLTFHVSRSVAASLQPGDELVVTTLDHDANVSPWRIAAADRGLVVRTVDIRPDDCTLDLESFDRALSSRTRLVAFGYASNAVGTVNPVAELVRRARDAGALSYVDAVHWAPHGPIDVAALGADFLVCSAYKFFGPHVGVLWARPDLVERLPAYKVRPAHDRIETGTPNFEGIAGTLAAIEYLAEIGRRYGGETRAAFPGLGGRRLDLKAGLAAIRHDEMALFERLASGLRAIRGVRLWGIADPARFAERAPTAAITIDGVHPRAAASALGRAGIAAWDGDFYATGLVERLGLADSGGLLRLGIVHYNTPAEVDRLLEALEAIASRPATAAGVRPVG
ncbi:MAG TPA: cysteine desulfurase-like protein [Candidatus Limnocylindrales bacterium]|nr:cysteine desulfurase-like protein [Candidatus Limnocylindrales bacterium]